MPKVTISPEQKTLDANPGETIYNVVRRNKLPLGSSCDGDGVCDKCRVTVLAGMQFLSPINDVEARLIREHGLGEDERVSCQTHILGDIVITTGYW